MNRPKRPTFTPQRRKKPQPNRGPARAIGGPRRRSPLDFVPNTETEKFRVQSQWRGSPATSAIQRGTYLGFLKDGGKEAVAWVDAGDGAEINAARE